MATYAGYQRYEVPDIGGNVAKIMLAQQEQDAKRMSAEELARYRQAKLDADKAKAHEIKPWEFRQFEK